MATRGGQWAAACFWPSANIKRGSGGRGQERPPLAEQDLPARLDELPQLPIGDGIVGQRHVAVAPQRPVRFEEMRLGVVGREDTALLDQDPADLMIDMRVQRQEAPEQLWQAAGVIR